MAFDETSGSGMVMPVGPMGGNGGGFGGWGDGGWWILLLFILLGNGWNNGGAFGGNGMGGLYPWMNQSNQISGGFRDQMLNDQLTGIQAGMTTGFTGITNQLYSDTIANLERSYAAQTASTAAINGVQAQLASCCCENRLATEGLKYVIAQENCADRQAISDGIKDLLTATQAQSQRVLDQLCADKLEAKNDLIQQLRSELMYARGQASQDVQTAAIQAGQRALANEVEQYVLPTPRPAYVVANPNCCYNPCGTNCGCGA
jgi:hypothetical protein